MSLASTFATVGIHDVGHVLIETIRTGRPAAPLVLGTGFWEYLAANPAEQEVFDLAMAEQAQLLSLPCVPLLDWPSAGTVADIAGGVGTLLAAVLQEAPGARGILVDQPLVLELAKPVLVSSGVADRCTLRAGDLFAPPPAADLYLLSRVLHDWHDESATRILASIAESAGPAARLRIFEDLLPENGLPAAAQLWSDVVMMALYDGARERTATEYRRLLEAGGWRFDRAVAGPPGMCVIEASRSPASRSPA
jgi:hypothetical protein